MDFAPVLTTVDTKILRWHRDSRRVGSPYTVCVLQKPRYVAIDMDGHESINGRLLITIGFNVVANEHGTTF